MTSQMSDPAQAYLAEYGELPTTREQQDRWTAFKFGYEAGQRQARQQVLRTAAHSLLAQADHA